MTTPSERLGRKVELALPSYGTPLRLLLELSDARDLYPRCMTVAYHASSSMIPLMESALERSRELAAEDVIAAGLVLYLERHIREEMHSDEPGGALLDDLATLDLDPAAIRARPVTPQIATLVDVQMALIGERHPVAILGFLELEAHQADRDTVERLIERTGLPRSAFGQLLLHARLDVVHARELHHTLDSLPVEPWHEQLIGLSALRTMTLVTDALLDAMGKPAGDRATVL